MAGPSLKTLVSIVNWNDSAATNKCLAGIAAIDRAVQPDVVVVDNGSAEELNIEPSVRKRLKSLKIVKNKHNLGFAGGHNPVIRLAVQESYDYVVLLNNDAEIIDKDLFAKLAQALSGNPKALGANPTILGSQNPDKVWYGGGRLSLKTGQASHIGVGQTASIRGTPRAVSLLTGGCLMISLRSRTSQDILLPEEYFVYWEDTEWSARAAAAGYQLLYVPNARLLHHVSSSLGVKSPSYIYYNIRNHILFIRRNVPIVFWPVALANVAWISLKYKLNILLRYRQSRIRCLKAVFWAWADGTAGQAGPLKREL